MGGLRDRLSQGSRWACSSVHVVRRAGRLFCVSSWLWRSGIDGSIGTEDGTTYLIELIIIINSNVEFKEIIIEKIITIIMSLFNLKQQDSD